MKKEYKRHNNLKINYILNLYREGKVFKALQFIHKYNQEYPKDIKGKVVEGKLLRLAGNPIEALEILEFTLPLIPLTSEFYHQALLEIIFAEIALNNYEKANKYYEQFTSIITDSNYGFLDTSNLRIFLRKKLNNYSSSVALDLYDYTSRQIISFSKEESIKKILNPNFIKNVSYELGLEEETTYFKDSIDLETLYEEILRIIPYATTLPIYSVIDSVIIKMNSFIGFDKYGELNHIKVSTFNEEDQINVLSIKPYRVICNKNFINNFNDLEIAYYLNEIDSKRTVVLKKQ